MSRPPGGKLTTVPRPIVQHAYDPTSAPADPAGPHPAPGTAAGGYDLRNVMVRGAFVRLMIAVSVLLTAAIVSLIYYNWVGARFPSSCIVVGPAEGESVDGVEVSVSGTDDERHVATVKLRGTEDSPILVEQGDYVLTVRYQGGSYRQQVAVPQRRLIRIPVTTRPAREPPGGRRAQPFPFHPPGAAAGPAGGAADRGHRPTQP